MTVSQTFLLVSFVIVMSNPSFVTSEQTCVTPTNPCDWPNCPQGDPGWRHEKVDVTIDRGELEDTIILDWAHTVLYPNLITGIFVDSTYYRRPQSPLKITKEGPVCTRKWFDIKLAYNVKDNRGIDLCYSTDIEIDPHPNEYMLVDKEVPMKKVKLSEDTYRVDWLKDMFQPRRYVNCLSSGQMMDEPFMEPSQSIYFTRIPYCSQTELDYKFYKGSRKLVTKILKADCNRTQEELAGMSGTGSHRWDGMLVAICILVIMITVLVSVVFAGFKIWNHYRCCQIRDGVVRWRGPSRFNTQPVPPANVYIYHPRPDNLQSGPYIPCSQADSYMSHSDK